MKKQLIIFLITCFALGSCKKLVDVDAPLTELARKTVFESDATANAAQLAIYSKMASEGLSYYGLSKVPGLSADELTDYSGGSDQGQLYTNNIQPDNGLVNDLWSQAYKCIYQCNAVLEGIENSNNISVDLKKQLIAEAKFTRAFNYFYLVNFFDEVPLLLTTDYNKNAVASRNTVLEIYDQILKDLEDAEANLRADYVGADGINVSSERLRPTQAAATAFLARVHLYLGEYSKAETEATAVIDNPVFALDESPLLDQTFLKQSQEGIWQLSTGVTFGNTYEGYNYVLLSPPYDVAINTPLYNAFENGDKRKDNWVGTYSDASGTWYFPNKYKVQYDPTNPREDVMVLRIAEQYLIRAEANAMQNHFQDAIDDINLIRLKHGGFVTPLPAPVNQTEAMNIILHERQVELFTEWGHRWLDLKRASRLDAVMTQVAPNKGGSWQSYQRLYPVPQSNRMRNPNLSQNPGYN
jgi:starch-binding outer membrane protein, SusD/RagB family